MRRKKHTDKRMDNKKMNDETYAQRRQVMDLIYRARNLINRDMPRIDVRICTPNELTERVVGLGGNTSIWILESTLNSGYLHQLVFHEIAHAIWNTPHLDGCLLMNPNVVLGSTPEEIDAKFVEYYKAFKKSQSKAMRVPCTNGMLSIP